MNAFGDEVLHRLAIDAREWKCFDRREEVGESTFQMHLDAIRKVSQYKQTVKGQSSIRLPA